MKSLKRIFTGMLIIFVMNLFLSHMTFAEHRVLYAKAGVTEHEPEILSTPEEDMPTVKVKKKSWGWYILLVLIAGGAAAAAGGGGDDESNGDATSSTTGSYTGTW